MRLRRVRINESSSELQVAAPDDGYIGRVTEKLRDRGLRKLLPLLALGSLVVGCRSSSAASNETAPKARAELGSFIEAIEAEADREPDFIETTGRIEYDEDHLARVVAPVSGRVIALLARPGDEVRAGQKLATIHSPEAASLAANFLESKTERERAKQAFERAKRLFEAGAGSEREVEEARSSFALATTAEEKDRALFQLMSPGKGKPSATYELKAPISGTITERNTSLGSAIGLEDGGAAFVVADLGRLWLFVDVFEQDIALVRSGSKVEVSVPAYPDEVFRGEVQHPGDTVDPDTRTARVRVSLENPDRRLKPGMFARVRLARPEHPAVRIPAAAVVTKASESLVYIEEGDGRFAPRRVIVGPARSGKVAIISGISPGERVVVKGALLLDGSMSQRM